MNPEASPRKTSGLAITSLVLGILSLLCCGLGLLGAIVAIVFGHIARGRIQANPETLSGAGLALAGLIIGYVSIAMGIITTPLFILGLPHAIAREKATVVLQDERQIYQAIQQTGLWPADSGITSASALWDALVAKGAITPEEATKYLADHLQVGNVSHADSGPTILLRTQPGSQPDGMSVIFLQNGNGRLYRHGLPVEGTLPARDPAFLAP